MKNFLKKNKSQIFKYLISGAISCSFSFLIYSTLYKYSQNSIISSFIGYFTGILISFTFARLWVFKKSRKNSKKKIIFYTFIYVLGSIEMTMIISIVNSLIAEYRISWLFGASIAAINNYLGTKYFVFKENI